MQENAQGTAPMPVREQAVDPAAEIGALPRPVRPEIADALFFARQLAATGEDAALHAAAHDNMIAALRRALPPAPKGRPPREGR